MTFDQIQTGVFQRLNKSQTPDPVTAARIQTFINDRYRQLLREGGIDVRDETLTIVTEASRARYALPADVIEIYNVFDSTNRITLRQVSLAEIRRRDPSVPAQFSGTSSCYAVLNEAGIGQQPTTIISNALRLISTQGADVGTVTIEFSGPSGGFNRVDVILNGVNPVIVPPAMQHVFRMYMAAAPVGTVELFQAAPSLTLARIPNGQINTATLHSWVIHFWPTPGGPYTMAIDFARPRRPLVDPSDEPAIPEEFHTLLVDGAASEEALKMDDTRAQTYEAKYRDGVRRFRAFLHQARGQRWIPKNRRRAWNDLGAWYPGYSDGGW